MRKVYLFLVGLLMVMSFSAFIPKISFAASDGDLVVQSIPGPTVSQKLSVRAKNSWPWYVTRASGLVAAFALIVLMLSGIGQVTGYTFKFLDPLTAWASHRALGIAFGISVLVHVLSLLFDKFVKFSILDILVPWLSHYKPAVVFGAHVGSLWVALGVLAFYLVAIIVITSLLWVEKKPYIWKWIHLLSYLTIVFVFVHALYIGTDMTHGIIRTLWIFMGIGIAASVLHRMWRLRNSA